MNKSYLLPAGLCLALAVPATAVAASAPKFPSDSIVPNVSLGGLKLNAPTNTAKAVFPAKDCNGGGCSYTAPDNTWSLSVMFAQKTKTAKPVIGEITLYGTPTASGLPSLASSSGVGIGSTTATLKKAYPHLVGNAKNGYGTTADYMKLPATRYGILSGRVNEISIRSFNFG